MFVFQYIGNRIKGNLGTPIEMEMLQKLSDLTLDVIGVCAFGYDFNGILGGNSEEGRATNTILTANFNIIRKSLEDLFPLLKLIPSKDRDDLKKAEEIFYGLIRKVLCFFHYEPRLTFSQARFVPSYNQG